MTYGFVDFLMWTWLKALLSNSGCDLATVVCALMWIYAIYFDRIRREVDLTEVYLYHDIENVTVITLPEENAWEICKDPSSKEAGYLQDTPQVVRVLPDISIIWRDGVKPTPMT